MTGKGSVDLFSRKIFILKTHKFSYDVKTIITLKKNHCYSKYLKIKCFYLFLWLSRKPFPDFLMIYIA